MIRNFLIVVPLFFLFFSLPLAAGEPAAAPLPTASWDKLPRWRGFNLLQKFQVASQKPFSEKDFQLIQELGFNFVRLPMDYRCWIVDGDWERFNEQTLREIDRAVEWGGKYGVHVCINFHRAPGYTVAKPPEKTSLWTDPKTQEVCARHWALFAKRYRGIPNTRLSFNLFNEPSHIEAAIYIKAMTPVVEAIRREDPERLIISDGLQWGRDPIPELKSMRIALATRGYAPGELTHYMASWVNGSDKYPLPTWPSYAANGLLRGASKKDMQAPIVIEGDFPAETMLRLHLHNVSSKAVLQVKADGRMVFEKTFEPKDGPGEWSRVVYVEQWKCYQNIYDKDYEAAIPKGTKRVEIGVAEGDWLNLSELSLIKPGGKTATMNLRSDWNEKGPLLRYDAGAGTLIGGVVKDRDWLLRTMIEPWKAAENEGIGVFVGEFGSYNKTPHDVTLRWMEDCLKNWQEAGWGWALWNLHGSFGILDSGRADVVYEEFRGHRLDRAMLELLQRY